MSISGSIGKLEETMRVLADIDQRLALILSRVGGSDHIAGLVSKSNLVRGSGDAADDLSSRFDQQLNYFMSLNESVVNTIEAIDQSLGVDTGSVDRPKGYKRDGLLAASQAAGIIADERMEARADRTAPARDRLR